jgi:hypothetical protein
MKAAGIGQGVAWYRGRGSRAKAPPRLENGGVRLDSGKSKIERSVRGCRTMQDEWVEACESASGLFIAWCISSGLGLQMQRGCRDGMRIRPFGALHLAGGEERSVVV